MAETIIVDEFANFIAQIQFLQEFF